MPILHIFWEQSNKRNIKLQLFGRKLRPIFLRRIELREENWSGNWDKKTFKYLKQVFWGAIRKCGPKQCNKAYSGLIQKRRILRLT